MTFRIDGRQRRAIIGVLLAGASLTSVLVALRAWFRHDASLVILLVPMMVLYLCFFQAITMSYATLDDSGIRSKASWLRTRTCTWPDVTNIDVRSRQGQRVVRITRRNGKHFNLGAPMNGAGVRVTDPDFDEKVARIMAFWHAHA